MSPVVAACFVPAPPLLIPEIGGDDTTARRLRADAITAVERVLREQPESVVVIASTPVAYRPAASGRVSWHGFGVGAAPGEDIDVMPWQLGIGAWLLDQAGWQGGRILAGVQCADEPLDLTTAGRVALLVLGDGSACRGAKPPGALGQRSDAWDAGLHELLASGDAGGLAALDQSLGAALMSSAAISFAAAGRLLSGGPEPAPTWHGEVSFDEAPFGVEYLIATWTSSSAGRS